MCLKILILNVSILILSPTLSNVCTRFKILSRQRETLQPVILGFEISIRFKFLVENFKEREREEEEERMYVQTIARSCNKP